MKKWIIFLSCLLIGGHLISEASEICERVWPSLKDIYVYPFIDPNYKWYDERGVNALWWIKYNSDDLLWVLTFFVMAKIAQEYAYRLFLISSLFFIYHVFDYFMLWYNYKTSHWMYWALNGIIIFCISEIIYPIRRKKAIVKSINN